MITIGRDNYEYRVPTTFTALITEVLAHLLWSTQKPQAKKKSAMVAKSTFRFYFKLHRIKVYIHIPQHHVENNTVSQ